MTWPITEMLTCVIWLVALSQIKSDYRAARYVVFLLLTKCAITWFWLKKQVCINFISNLRFVELWESSSNLRFMGISSQLVMSSTTNNKQRMVERSMLYWPLHRNRLWIVPLCVLLFFLKVIYQLYVMCLPSLSNAKFPLRIRDFFFLLCSQIHRSIDGFQLIPDCFYLTKSRKHIHCSKAT